MYFVSKNLIISLMMSRIDVRFSEHSFDENCPLSKWDKTFSTTRLQGLFAMLCKYLMNLLILMELFKRATAVSCLIFKVPFINVSKSVPLFTRFCTGTES